MEEKSHKPNKLVINEKEQRRAELSLTKVATRHTYTKVHSVFRKTFFDENGQRFERFYIRGDGHIHEDISECIEIRMRKITYRG